jgi:ABC-type uncharacterized transport system substrate-binding protein
MNRTIARRPFLKASAYALLAAPLAAEGQKSGKVPRVGVIVPVEPESLTEPHLAAFRQTLRDLGYAEGQNIAVEYRYAHGKAELYAALASELVRLQVDMMVVGSWHPTLEAKKATQTIPIVGVGMGTDPIALGIVASLARPGGNVTGVTNMARDLTRKRLELLKEAVPKASRVAVIMNPDDPIVPPQWRDAEEAAAKLRVHLQRFEVRNTSDLERAVEGALAARADAVLRLADPLAATQVGRTVELLTKYRLPAMVIGRSAVEAGALMSYFADPLDYYARPASHVDRILRGAQPGDLPVEQPTKFGLFINAKTARALGLTIPQSLLLRADRVIQ